MAHPLLERLFSPPGDDSNERASRFPERRRARDKGVVRGEDGPDDPRLQRIRSGDSAVFEELYAAYFEELAAFAFRYVRDPTAAEDVVHDVFLKLWSIRTTLDVQTTLRAYLFSVVANRARDVAAQVRRDTVIFSPLLGNDVSPSNNIPTISGTPYDSLESADIRTVVMTAVASLPERQRLALTLRLANDMTYDEIATVLGITKSSVAELIAKAQVRLKLLLGTLLA